jgi:aminopeptidase N
MKFTAPSDYLLVNPDQVGFFRVMYDDANWMLLAEELKSGNFEAFSPVTRAMLIDDAGTFANMYMLNMKLFFELLSYLKHETDYVPWHAVNKYFLYVDLMLRDESSELYENYKVFKN